MSIIQDTTILHVTFAILSIIITGITAFMPTLRRVRVSVASIAFTLGSGVLLAVLDNSLILHVCMTGLVYLVIESAGVAFSVARMRRLAYAVATRDQN